MKNWLLNLKEKKIFPNILCFVVALPGLFLLTNGYPIFGVGFGRFNDINFPDMTNNFSFTNMHIFLGYPKIVSFFMEGNFDSSAAHAHNSYANFLAETGIIGLGLIILFWILCFRLIFRSYLAVNDELAKKYFCPQWGGGNI